MFPIDVSIASPLAGTDLLLCALFGGVILGIGSGIAIRYGGVFGSGVTRLEAKGGYSNEEKSMIYFVVNRYQVVRMKELVHEIDHSAYITISEVADVFSNNHSK